MFRKLLLSAIVGLGAVTPFVSAPKAEAEPFRHPHHHRYRVFYRCSCREPWRFYARYDCFPEARQAAHCLRERGFEVEIR